MNYTKGEWTREDKLSGVNDQLICLTTLRDGAYYYIAEVMQGDGYMPDEEYEANAHLIAAAPLGYELAEMVLAQKADGLDRSEAIYQKAFDFMFKAEGKEV